MRCTERHGGGSTDDEAEGVRGGGFYGDETRGEDGVSAGEVRWGTNLCKHSHRPVLPRHCGSSPACIAGSAAPLCCAYSSRK